MNAQIIEPYCRLIEATVRQAQRDLEYSGPSRWLTPTPSEKLSAKKFLAYMLGEEDYTWQGIATKEDGTTQLQ